MAHSDNIINAITLPNGTTYDIHDEEALHSISATPSSASDTTVLGGMTASGNTVTGTKKTISGDGTYTKAEFASNTISISHLGTQPKSQTSSPVAPAHGGSFTVLDSVTFDAKGHATAFNTKTVTLPTISFRNGTSLPPDGTTGEIFLLTES